MNHRASVLSVAILWSAVATVAYADTFTVINTDDTGTGSLRQAITDANNHAGLDTIAFNIPGSGVHTIGPATGLPQIAEAVVIDGYTQPANGGAAASPNTLANGDNAVLLIELNGSTASGGGLLFNTGAAGSTVRGLVINRFSDGIDLFSSNCVVEGNFIGTDPTGTIARGNTNDGINLSGNGNLIGGTTPAARNIVSGNLSDGISGQSASMNVVQGNFIGVAATGTNALGNGSAGIVFFSDGNLIGGTTAAVRNIISGNGNSGVRLEGNLGNMLQGNFIGTDVTGTSALGNTVDGVNLRFGTGFNTVSGNVISANGRAGIVVESSESNNMVQANFIGTDVTGTLTLGNADRGVVITDANHTTIEGNTIAHNGLDGIGVRDNVSTNNQILGNSIFENAGLGIDLLLDGATLNDPGDPDTGPNNLQNYPVINSVTITGGNATITGSINSTANTTFRLEFFSNLKADPSGLGEGETFLGFTNVTTDASGDAPYNVTFPVSATARAFTATATDSNGNTSEFSPAFLTRLLNISTRMKVLTSEKVLIGGFIVTGAGPKRAIIRGIGPSLGGQGVSGALQDPTLELNGAVTIDNDNWRSDQEAEIIATGIPPSNDLESAIVANLSPGAYTAILAGKDSTTGVGLVEVYDLDQSAGSKLANISTRGFVDTGDNVMIGGFIAGPASTGAISVLLRAIGPSLIGAGIQDALLDPTLELHDGSGAVVATNDNWRDTQQAEIEATGIPPTDDRESAILQTVVPGNYTAIVRGKDNTTGVALVEAYNLE